MGLEEFIQEHLESGDFNIVNIFNTENDLEEDEGDDLATQILIY